MVTNIFEYLVGTTHHQMPELYQRKARHLSMRPLKK